MISVAGIIPMTTGRAAEAGSAQTVALKFLANLVVWMLVMPIRHPVLRIMP